MSFEYEAKNAISLTLSGEQCGMLLKAVSAYWHNVAQPRETPDWSELFSTIRSQLIGEDE